MSTGLENIERPQAAGKRKPITRNEEAPWTAARCNRLLRTITSRLGILRKLAKPHVPLVETAVPCVAKDTALIFPDPSQYSNQSSNHALSATSPLARDPDWIPQNRKRRCNRTYAGNSKRRKVKFSEENGLLAHRLSTPFVKRLLVSAEAQSLIVSPTTPTFGKRSQENQIGRKRRGIPLLPTTSADQAYGALLEALGSILITTRPDPPSPRLGARSLVETCLRKIPAYIEFEKTCAECEPDTEGNVTTEIYEYLEGFGSRNGGGWKGLRYVVRAHVVSLIEAAMKNGTLPGDPLDDLLAVCSKYGAREESRSILRAWILSNSGLTTARLDTFIRKCAEFGHRSLLLQICRDAVQNGHIAINYLKEHSCLWFEVTRAFATISTRADASSFCQAFLVGCMRDKGSAGPQNGEPSHGWVQQAISFVTALAWTTRDPESAGGVLQHLFRITFSALATVDAETRGKISTTSDHVKPADSSVAPFLWSILTLLATGFQMCGNVQSMDVNDLLCVLTMNGSDAITSKASEFITSIAVTISRADHANARDFVKSAATGVLRMAKAGNSEYTDMLRVIAKDTAKIWADNCNDNESYSLLEEVEFAIWSNEMQETSSTPARTQQPTTYRWEEGLCEWVAKSPIDKTHCVASPPDKCLESLHDSGIELEFDSPGPRNAKKEPQLSVKDTSNYEIEGWDEEDELALITPVHRRRKARQVRFDVEEQDACFITKALRLSNVDTNFDDTSDDELA